MGTSVLPWSWAVAKEDRIGGGTSRWWPGVEGEELSLGVLNTDERNFNMPLRLSPKPPVTKPLETNSS